MSEAKWFCAEKSKQNRWEGPFDTREQAEQECLGYYADGGFVAEGRMVKAEDWVPSGDDVLQWMEQHAYDNDEGDPDGETFEASSAALEELEQTITEWARQNVSSHWYVVDGEQFPVRPEPKGDAA